MVTNHLPEPFNLTLDELLDLWHQQSWLRSLDVELVKFFNEKIQYSLSWPTGLAIALCSYQLGRGHVCLDIKNVLSAPYRTLSLPPDSSNRLLVENIPLPEEILSHLQAKDWLKDLSNHPELISQVNNLDDISDKFTPFILYQDCLYLNRYWRYERKVEQFISDRLKTNTVPNNPKNIPGLLDGLFPASENTHIDWQKIAVALASQRQFTIITGGPGTGKTTTVVRLLALLLTQHQNNVKATHLKNSSKTLPPLQIKLAAPTGKAAARLKESLTQAAHQLPEAFKPIEDQIPTEVTTLHRLLGAKPNSRFFVHNQHNRLILDVLVVDEASMIDLEMMYSLLSALPPECKLILLGDKDQLASVEAGSVLGELCSRAERAHYNNDTLALIQKLCTIQLPNEYADPNGQALDQNTIMLRQSRRFSNDSGIGKLATAINRGNAIEIKKLLHAPSSDINIMSLSELTNPTFNKLLTDPNSGLTVFLKQVHHVPELTKSDNAFDQWAKKVLHAHSQFQILSPVRSGPFGVEGINRYIESWVHSKYKSQNQDAWYLGKPIIITKNDYQLGLMNGDIGITLIKPRVDKKTGQGSMHLKVAFIKNDGSGDILWVAVNRIHHFETVYALTVHKSQGSEFNHCALVIPPNLNPILTRELIYTGITRAKKQLSLICATVSDSASPFKVLTQACERTVERSGRLFK